MKYLIQFFFKGKSTQGFTLIELLVVIVMAGILFGIAAPSYLAFVSRQRLNTAQSAVLGAIRDAQSKAKKDKINYQVSFRENNAAVQYVVHSTPACDATTCPGIYNSLAWSNLDQDNNTNILMRGISADYDPSAPSPPNPDVVATYLTNVRRVRFNFKGNYLDRSDVYIVLKSKGGDSDRRCVTIATLLGATRNLREGETTACN